MAKQTVTTSKAFESIDDSDLASVAGGAGLGDLISIPLGLLQQGVALVSSIDPTGIVGTVGGLVLGVGEKFRDLLSGFGR